MPDPTFFDSATPRFGLPFLYAGQAQKEFFVNEAHALADALLHCAVEAERSEPPASPEDGQSWLVGSAPTAEWSGKAGTIASRVGGNWLFIAPVDGMRVLDRATGQEIRFADTWRRPLAPDAPSGGATVDAEVRAALAALIAALTDAGVFAAA